MSDKAMNQSRFMLKALSLAEQGKGFTPPNPCVGALLVSGDRILGRGWHRACGDNHAEVEAIENARQNAADLTGCTMYVTLEPCNHHGRTPPCTRAILEAGIPEVVIGARDTNSFVQGGGAEYLKSRGIKVTIGVEEQKCLDLIADFCLWQKSGRPYVYLKTASTLDGRIGTRTGHSRWVTSVNARQVVHHLRSRTGAVLVGGNTFYQDNPELTCRTHKVEQQPLAVIITSRLPDPKQNWYLLQQRPTRTVFWTNTSAAGSEAARRLVDLGCKVMGLDRDASGLDLLQGLQRLRSEMGVYHLMCEGGGKLAAGLLQQGLVDELWAFVALKILGDEQGIPVSSGRDVQLMHDTLDFRLGEIVNLGPELLLKLFPRQQNC
ncbi:bifunctional diaminohydroxyphosphoribosylaminopyrimidine deaminase/5-amino-6-(5-phosphoribosylamino)uracil reductase RibD [Desulfonatronospira sp.]|uniref:bifunctional diaminohydroxyphosphoribosylaminopyrimidine deaminase/5-amino-6-(5-phosphoribosylamino)uracil reductase RibD n=1 Tax=Desulfonatronospira sp. TaxID=1962951 RepID=UPI0025C702D7|nr:bifunctional diaminohydroxyphosphoribosylaminopyrimidine deaminase/5-amino-6-(5-phosphoribosylamino)uracil reductase RibD [Desulfonatronospira sp.]